MFNRIQTHRLMICTSEKDSFWLYNLQCTVMHPEEVSNVTDTGSLNKQILQPCSINYCASTTLNCKHILWMYRCLQWYRNKHCTQKSILLSCHGLLLSQFPNTWWLPTWHTKLENVWMYQQPSSRTWLYQKQKLVSFHSGSDTLIFISTAMNSDGLMAAHSAPTQKLNLKSVVPQWPLTKQHHNTIKKKPERIT